MPVFGAAITAAAPATQVLVLDCVARRPRGARSSRTSSRRMALGMAVGAFAAGLSIDLDDPERHVARLRGGGARLRRVGRLLALAAAHAVGSPVGSS